MIRSGEFSPVLDEWAYRAHASNNWFTPENVKNSIHSIATQLLEEGRLTAWLNSYPETAAPAKIGVVMAGNIPAVGFHDALCVLISGHHLLAKLSSDDPFLIRALLSSLLEIEPEFSDFIHYVDRLNDATAYIATGSDNSSRYFEYYFASKPHIIRRNRVSVAVLSGEETEDELVGLGNDILTYYGLGCRNVSKIYAPEHYDFIPFYKAIEPLRNYCIHNHKFFNNYEYNRSILLVNRVDHLDNGFLMINESKSLVSPLSVLNYETYSNLEELSGKLAANSEKIQCIVGRPTNNFPTIPFGFTQSPGLTDYADGVDTMQFLSSVN